MVILQAADSQYNSKLKSQTLEPLATNQDPITIENQLIKKMVMVNDIDS